MWSSMCTFLAVRPDSIAGTDDDDQPKYSDTNQQDEESMSWHVQLAWFFAATGQMASWTAMGAFISLFRLNFGDSIQLELNLSYFLPAFPMLIATITLVPRLDRVTGHFVGLGSRIGICMLALALLMFVFPTAVAQHGKAWVMACSALIGIFGGLAYGSMFALVRESVVCLLHVFGTAGSLQWCPLLTRGVLTSNKPRI